MHFMLRIDRVEPCDKVGVYPHLGRKITPSTATNRLADGLKTCLQYVRFYLQMATAKGISSQPGIFHVVLMHCHAHMLNYGLLIKFNTGVSCPILFQKFMQHVLLTTCGTTRK